MARELNAKNRGGFTLTEVLIVVGLVFFAASLTAANFSSFQRISILADQADMITQTLREAKELARSGYQGKSHGVYFDESSGSTLKIVLYQGSSYEARSVGKDRILELEPGITISASTLRRNEANSIEVNFSLQQGQPDNYGAITISDNSGNSMIIVVGSAGTIY